MWPNSLWRVGWKQWTAYSMLCSAQETQRIQIFPPPPPQIWLKWLHLKFFIAPGAPEHLTALGWDRWESWSSPCQHLVGGAGSLVCIRLELVSNYQCNELVSWRARDLVTLLDITSSPGRSPRLPPLWQGKWCGDSQGDITATAWLSPSSSIEMERTWKCIININQKSCQSSQIKPPNAVLTTQADRQLLNLRTF